MYQTSLQGRHHQGRTYHKIRFEFSPTKSLKGSQANFWSALTLNHIWSKGLKIIKIFHLVFLMSITYDNVALFLVSLKALFFLARFELSDVGGVANLNNMDNIDNSNDNKENSGNSKRQHNNNGNSNNNNVLLGVMWTERCDGQWQLQRQQGEKQQKTRARLHQQQQQQQQQCWWQPAPPGWRTQAPDQWPHLSLLQPFLINNKSSFLFFIFLSFFFFRFSIFHFFNLFQSSTNPPSWIPSPPLPDIQDNKHRAHWLTYPRQQSPSSSSLHPPKSTPGGGLSTTWFVFIIHQSINKPTLNPGFRIIEW